MRNAVRAANSCISLSHVAFLQLLRIAADYYRQESAAVSAGVGRSRHTYDCIFSRTLRSSILSPWFSFSRISIHLSAELT